MNGQRGNTSCDLRVLSWKKNISDSAWCNQFVYKYEEPTNQPLQQSAAELRLAEPRANARAKLSRAELELRLEFEVFQFFGRINIHRIRPRQSKLGGVARGRVPEATYG